MKKSTKDKIAHNAAAVAFALGTVAVVGGGTYTLTNRPQAQAPVAAVTPAETAPVVQATNHVYIYQATVERVVDGDTVRVQIPSFPPPFNPIAVRVDHVNTPESRAPAKDCEIVLGQRASAFGHAAMPEGSTVTVLYDDRRTDKYGRLLARIVLPNGLDYGQSLIEAGLAKPYEGGRKTEWC